MNTLIKYGLWIMVFFNFIVNIYAYLNHSQTIHYLSNVTKCHVSSIKGIINYDSKINVTYKIIWRKIDIILKLMFNKNIKKTVLNLKFW